MAVVGVVVINVEVERGMEYVRETMAKRGGLAWLAAKTSKWYWEERGSDGMGFSAMAYWMEEDVEWPV